MSIEKDLELMDDYLANRLNDADRTSFEQKLEADPALKSEFISQQNFIEGIKKARIAELKNIMNNTPIPPAAGVGTTLTVKIATWVVVVGLVGLGIYWFSSDEGVEPVAMEEINQVEIPETAVEIEEDQPVEDTDPAEPEAEIPTTKEEQIKTTKPKATSKVKQPKLEVYDPTKDVKEEDTNESMVPAIPGERNKATSLIVETDNTQKKFDFHYQFKEGKLILMGSFDTTLYEILEFIADDKRTIFLYYTGKYYLLDETKSKPTPLNPIKDSQLLKKLDTYRGE
jgi:hypothetical protein